jgi:putative transcriptional regulator
MPELNLAGRLIVATPLLGDPNFVRTVILLLAHTDEGAFGVVLNRPSHTSTSELLPQWGEVTAAPEVVFVGGPVARDAVVGVRERPERAGSDRFATVDLNLAPWEQDESPESVRLFAGSAGWSGGQLEAEIAERAWWICEAARGDALTADPAGLWARVLRRQAPPTCWFANFPAEDLTAN